MASLDMTKTEFASRENVPIGKYNFVVGTVKKTPAKNAGDTNVKMEYDIISGGQQKRKIFDNVVFNKDSQWKVFMILRAIAPNLNKSVALNEDSFVKAITGQRFSAEVVHKPSIKDATKMIAQINPNSYAVYDPSLNEVGGQPAAGIPVTDGTRQASTSTVGLL